MDIYHPYSYSLSISQYSVAHHLFAHTDGWKRKVFPVTDWYGGSSQGEVLRRGANINVRQDVYNAEKSTINVTSNSQFARFVLRGTWTASIHWV